MREQLVRAAEVLSRCAATLFPTRRRAERERARHAMVQHYHEHKHAEHHRVLQRHKIIEERKEYIERLNTVREEEELRCITFTISIPLSDYEDPFYSPLLNHRPNLRIITLVRLYLAVEAFRIRYESLRKRRNYVTCRENTLIT